MLLADESTMELPQVISRFALSFGRMALLVIIPLVAMELLSFFFFSNLCSRFSFCATKTYTVSAEKIEKFKKAFDVDLGWKRKYPTPFGERPRRFKYDKTLMAVYGDSFTHCDQVKSRETWEEQLAQHLKQGVYNFGVGGYGTDQAYLRFKAEFPKIQTPIVGLGLITENINRLVNVYRPFYHEGTAGGLPKPRFTLNNGKLELIPNPIQSSDELRKLLDPSFVRTLGKNDWWYNRDNLPTLEFPYLRIFFNKRFWLELAYGSDGQEINDANPRPWNNLWEYAPARDIMFAVLDSFIEEAKALQVTPLILILPRRSEVFEKIEGKTPKDLAVLLQFCEKRGYLCFDGISAMARNARSQEHAKSFFRPHLSPRGNIIFARELHQFLLQKGLVL